VDTYSPILLQDYLPPETYPEVGEMEPELDRGSATVTGGVVGALVGAGAAFAYTSLTGRGKALVPKVDLEVPSDEDAEHEH